MSDTKDLLNAIISGNNVDAERIFQDNMASTSWRQTRDATSRCCK